MTDFLVCPHCGGQLIMQLDEDFRNYMLWMYDCRRCGRGFKVFPDGHWQAIGDANATTYTKEEVEEAQK
jgi:DNA-directed RNA polymerase subunit RPC12/RpoP